MQKEASVRGDQLLAACQGLPQIGSWVTPGSQAPQHSGAGGYLLQSLRLQEDSKRILGTTLGSKFEDLYIIDKFLEKYR